jgi:large subunit ribosomal protein L1
MIMAKATTPEEKQAKDETRDEVTEARKAGIDLPQDATHAEVEQKEGDVTPEQTGDVIEESGDGEDKPAAHTTKAGKHSAKAQREAEAEEKRQEAKEHRADTEAEHAPKPPRRQQPNPLHQHGKKYREAAKLVDRTKAYPLAEALDLAKQTATTKFDATVELHVNLGVDPRQADQMVRSSVVLPHGTGRTVRVALFADGAAAEAAKAAGADLVGTDKLLADIEKGKLNFDMLVATPDKMATLGRVAKILGPRGLMPNPKSGTVTPDAAKAVKEAKAGKVEFRIDKQAIVHQAIGKASFKVEDLRANAEAFLGAILKAKPAAAKGTYVKAITMATSMGPGIKLDAPATISAISTSKR